MWKTAVLCLFCSSLAWSLSESERTEKVKDFFDSSMQEVSPKLKKWLTKQGVPKEQLFDTMLRSKYKRIARRINRIEKHFKGPYVASSDIITPCQEYIVSAAPPKKNLTSFWQTIIDRRVPTIVALVTPDFNPTEAYWDKSKYPMKLSEWVITLHSEETLDTSVLLPHVKLIKRVFYAEGVRRDERRTIIHLHFANWPDHGPPVHEVFCGMLDYVDEVHRKDDRPIFVHCAGGIGRSGTFVAAHSLRKEYKRYRGPTTINIPQRIIELRTQRPRLVSQPAQLHAVYAAVADLVAKG